MKEVDMVDDDLTIVSVTISGCCKFMAETSVDVETLNDKNDLCNSTNYLVRKLAMKADAVIKEGELIKLF